jgi:hypothetical protein
MWSYLQPVEDRQAMDFGCSRLEMVARDLYNQCAGGLLIESPYDVFKAKLVSLFSMVDPCINPL